MESWILGPQPEPSLSLLSVHSGPGTSDEPTDPGRGHMAISKTGWYIWALSAYTSIKSEWEIIMPTS